MRLNKKKIILWIAGIAIVTPLLAYGVFWLILYFTLETPKDNDVIERDLNSKKIQDLDR